MRWFVTLWHLKSSSNSQSSKSENCPSRNLKIKYIPNDIFFPSSDRNPHLSMPAMAASISSSRFQYFLTTHKSAFVQDFGFNVLIHNMAQPVHHSGALRDSLADSLMNVESSSDRLFSKYPRTVTFGSCLCSGLLGRKPSMTIYATCRLM